jgi:hypothetical protein
MCRFGPLADRKAVLFMCQVTEKDLMPLFMQPPGDIPLPEGAIIGCPLFFLQGKVGKNYGYLHRKASSKDSETLSLTMYLLLPPIEFPGL